VVAALLEHLFNHRPQPETFLCVGLNLLLELDGPCALDVLAETFKLFFSFLDFEFELSDLLFKGHHQESLLLILLSCLRQWHQVLVRVGLTFASGGL